MPKSSVSKRKLYVAVVTACVSTVLFLAAALAAPEPPDYPAEHCVFLQPIPYDAPIDPYSDQLIQDLADVTYGQDDRFRLQLGKWTMAKYTVNGDNYQVEDVYLSKAWGVTGYWLRDVPIPTDQTLKVTPDSDAAIEIIDPNHGIEYTFWACSYNNRDNTWKRNKDGYLEASMGEAIYLNGSGSSPVGEAARGCGIASSLGLVLPGELEAGTVNHALAYFFPNPAPDPCPPATHSDGGNFGTPVYYPNRLPETAVFRLKPSVWTDEAIENATHTDGTPWNWTEKTLAYAARDYGLYVTDNTGAHHVVANTYLAYPSDPYETIEGCEPDGRVLNQYVRLWNHHFVDTANFEVIDTVTFPYIQDDRRADYDGDGVLNAAESAWGWRDYTWYDETNDPSNGLLDWDADGLTNAQECELLQHFAYLPLNPFDADSDNDGYPDADEAFDWSADPTNPYIVPDPAWPGMPSGENVALNKTVTSSVFVDPQFVVDGDESTSAAAAENKTGSLTIDFGASVEVARVVIKWLGLGFCYGVGYTVEMSPDNSNWTTIYTETEGNGGIDDLYLGCTGAGRYLKLDINDLGSPWGLWLVEVEVYGPTA